MKRIPLILCLGAAVLGAAEPQAWNWPNYIRVCIEEVKPGKEGPHQQNEFAWSKAMAAGRSPYHFSGMTPVAGPSNQAWWVWPLESMADQEKLHALVDRSPELKAKIDPIAARESEFINGYAMSVYRLRKDLSAGPVAFQPRYYWIFTDTLRVGREDDFTAHAKLVLETYAKAGIPTKWGVYQAMAGTPDPTVMVVIPLRSLAEIDALVAAEGKFVAALGPEGAKTLARLEADSIVREGSFLLGVDPKLSYPSPEDIAADPEFWKAWVERKPAPKK